MDRTDMSERMRLAVEIALKTNSSLTSAPAYNRFEGDRIEDIRVQMTASREGNFWFKVGKKKFSGTFRYTEDAVVCAFLADGTPLPPVDLKEIKKLADRYLPKSD